jgi:hypothetical protein
MLSAKTNLIVASTAGLLLLCGLSNRALGGEINIVVPNGFEEVEGNDGDVLDATISETGMRYQQVYPASQFAALPSSNLVLTAIRNRPDGAVSGPFSIIPTDVTIRLSTTDKEPGQLSSVFSENIGPDETTVLEEVVVNGSANVGPPGGPKEFDMEFVLQTPFHYDPSQGNLLYDLTMRGEVPQACLDFDGGLTFYSDC